MTPETNGGGPGAVKPPVMAEVKKQQEVVNSAMPGDIIEGDGQTLDRVIRLLCRELNLPPYKTLREVVSALQECIETQREPVKRELEYKEFASVSVQTTAVQAAILARIPPDMMEAPAAFELLQVCVDLAGFLMGKNLAYGDSALNPLRAISKADPAEQIRVRMDDKLSRLIRGQAAGEDALKDLVGYWVLLQVLESRKLPEAQHNGGV